MDKMEISEMSSCVEQDHSELSESNKASFSCLIDTILHSFALFIYISI